MNCLSPLGKSPAEIEYLVKNLSISEINTHTLQYTYTSQALERDTPIGTMGTSLGELKYVYCGRSIDMITTYFGANMNIYTREHIYVTPMGTSLGENKYVYYGRNIDMITIYFGTNMNIFTREHMYTRHLWAPH